ncbi:MAG: cyclopropane-fatty-acyl-phospholipid synthase family protein [Gammaproteobacteria bacterium]
MFLKLLEKHIKTGILHLHLPGIDYIFGTSGTEAHWHFNDLTVLGRIARDWEFELGKTYVEGGWHAGSSGLHALLEILRSNFAVKESGFGLRTLSRLLQQFNRITSSYRNVSHHYDVPEPVFRRFLDQEMFYSCAYFPEPGMSLAAAQQAKARHIASKLLIKPGDHILDIGCGWGSMVFYLATHFDCEVTGITLSREQLAVATREQERRGLKNVRFELADYREHQGSYDRIVSIGMFEHVGRPFHHTYFRRVYELLKQEGVALIHTIGRAGPPGVTNRWIREYIFPGGSTPALSELATAVESTGMRPTDMEVWRLHYAQTLQHWFQRFQQSRHDITELMQEEFCRMWEFYLAVCEAAFRYSDLVVYQLQLSKQHGPVPTTRNYLYQ